MPLSSGSELSSATAIELFTTVDLSVLLVKAEPIIGTWLDHDAELVFSGLEGLENEEALEVQLVW